MVSQQFMVDDSVGTGPPRTHFAKSFCVGMSPDRSSFNRLEWVLISHWWSTSGPDGPDQFNLPMRASAAAASASSFAIFAFSETASAHDGASQTASRGS